MSFEDPKKETVDELARMLNLPDDDKALIRQALYGKQHAWSALLQKAGITDEELAKNGAEFYHEDGVRLEQPSELYCEDNLRKAIDALKKIAQSRAKE